MRRQGRDSMHSRSSRSGLIAMMDADDGALPPWSARDLAAIMDHLLAAPLDAQLPPDPAHDGMTADWGDGGSTSSTSVGEHDWTFADVLGSADVPYAVLLRVKEYAKHAIVAGDALPREAAKALYVAVVVQAQLCGHPSLSGLSPASLLRLSRWCLAQGWLPPSLRELVRRGTQAT